MGVLRLWLALFVYFEHLGSGLGLNHFLEGIVAVKSFFIISGFLMQLVTLEKYYAPGQAWRRDFWKSRFLRIYPLYWAVLLAGVLFIVATGDSPRLYHAPPSDYGMSRPLLHHELMLASHNALAKLWYFASHLFIFGYDLGQYIVYDPAQDRFHLIADSHYIGHFWGRSFMLIPQAWSIAIELWFYLLAPFLLLRRTLPLALITFAVVAGRNSVHFAAAISAYDILGELGFFVSGALACRFYLRYLKGRSERHYLIALLFLLGIAALGLSYQANPFGGKDYAMYLLVCASLPFLFHSFHRNPLDRFLGDMSYPIYLVHFLAYGLAATWLTGPPRYALTMLLTLLLALAGLFLVEKPIDRLRHRLFRGKAA